MQTEQDLAVCAAKFPKLIARLVASHQIADADLEAYAAHTGRIVG